METTKKNQEEKAKDELLNKREVLSEEDLMEVAGGGISNEKYRICMDYCDRIFSSNLSYKVSCHKKCKALKEA